MALLHDGLGVNMQDDTLLFTDTITAPDGHPVTLDWTLGEAVVPYLPGTEPGASLMLHGKYNILRSLLGCP